MQPFGGGQAPALRIADRGQAPIAGGGQAPALRDHASIRLTLRRFRPPRPVEVLLDGDRPRALSGDGLSAQLAIAAGPYRTSGEWWTEGGFTKDAWDVHAEGGALYRLARDGAGRWFVEGYYD